MSEPALVTAKDAAAALGLKCAELAALLHAFAQMPAAPPQNERKRPVETPVLVDAKTVAAALGLKCADSVYKWARRGKVPSFKVGSSRKFDLEEIKAAMRRDVTDDPYRWR